MNVGLQVSEESIIKASTLVPILVEEEVLYMFSLLIHTLFSFQASTQAQVSDGLASKDIDILSSALNSARSLFFDEEQPSVYGPAAQTLEKWILHKEQLTAALAAKVCLCDLLFYPTKPF